MAFIESFLLSLSQTLFAIGPALSLILVLLAGIVYALAQSQPPEMRGKWVSTATNLFIGGIILAAIVGAASLIVDTAGNFLT